MRSTDGHLTPLELESLLFTGSAEDLAGGAPEASREAKQHLEGCTACQAMAKRYVQADSALRALGVRGQSRNRLPRPPDESHTRGPDCPPPETWLRLAAGLLDEAAAAQYVSHAAHCDWCGPLLREAMEDLAQDVTAEEQAALDRLGSANPAWQREMGKKLAAAAVSGPPAATPASPGKEKSKFRWWPGVAAAAATVLAAVGGWQVWVQTRLPYAERLLAQAYTKHRTIELRIPGAQYAPMLDVTRGAEAPTPTAEYYQAQAIIQKEVENHPQDAAWLQADARAALLQGDYDDAMKNLDVALELRPHAPGILLDKATAQFERAERSNDSSIGYAESLETLTLVLQQRPDDPIALFNRAVVAEKLHLPDNAIADLEHYLRVDPGGSWSGEARERLQRLKGLVKAHDDAAGPISTTPDDFVRLMGDPAAVEGIDQRIEDYLSLSVNEWLPKAFPMPGGESAGQAMPALRALAEMLSTRHKDPWLSDLLDSSNSSPTLAEALASLHQAIALAPKDPAAANSASQKAEALFRNAGSRAGALRAEVEQVHALQRLQRSSECLAKARAAYTELKDVAFPWIRIQLQVDRAACALNLGSFDQGRAYLSEASGQTVDSAFPVLHSRAIGITAAFDDLEGDLPASWAANEAGLAEYWRQTTIPPVRAHQFYDVLAYSSEKLNLWNVAVAFAWESAKMVALTGNVPTEALARRHLADIAVRAGQFDLATEELNTAARLGGLNDSARIYSEVTLAAIDSRQGRLEGAEKRLQSVAAAADSVDAFTIPRAFHQIKGDLRILQGQDREAEEEYLRALEIMESAHARLRDDSERESWNEENAQLYRSLIAVEQKTGATRKALAAWEWYRAARMDLQPGASLRAFLSGSELENAVGSLRGQTVLSYSLLPHGLMIWVADDRGIISRFVSLDPTDLESLSSRFLNLCAYPSGLPELRATGRRLFDLLVAPVSDRLSPQRTIVVETDDLMGDIPFQALLAPSGRYLSETYAMVLSPGFLYQARLRSSGPISGKTKALIVGSTAHLLGKDVQLRLDKNVEGETEDIAARFASVRLKDREATGEAIEKALPQAEVFHFVGHALSGSRGEGLLVFTSQPGADGTELWDAKRVKSNLFEKSQLVVLAACSTGRTFQRRDGVHGDMVRSILAARVPNIVASKWDVDSEQTRRLMKLFYDGLIDGQPVTSALRDAELKLLSDPRTAHPYYWAAFAAFGRP